MAKTRVHELAKEFGVESKFILEKLREMGEFVKSASSFIELPAEMRFRKLWGPQLRGEGGPPPPQPRSATPPAAGSLMANRRNYDRRQPRRPRAQRPTATPPSTNLTEASRVFGVPVEELKPAKQERPRGRYASSESRRPLTDWDKNWIDAQERREWIAAGLGPDDGRIAGRLKEKDISPEDLMTRVDGIRVSERLRGGESVVSVAARLRELKRGRDSGTA